MSVDWITVAAQLANFLILVWLLKRFLYRPILDGIDAREAEIAQRMDEARQIRDAAHAKLSELTHQRDLFESQQSAALKASEAQAKVIRQSMIAQTREQLDAERVTFARAQQAEAKRYLAKLQQSGAEALLALLSKALIELADETFEERMVIQAGRQIEASGQKLKEAAAHGVEAVITTRNALSDAARANLKKQIAVQLPEVTLQFTTDPSQAPGLILRIGGAQASWTLDSYVGEWASMLEDQVTRTNHVKSATDAH